MNTKTLHKPPESMMKFSGTPTEIGGQIWERMCLPAVRHTSNNQESIVLQGLYMGFIGALFGSMVADFGFENAVDGVEHVLKSLKSMENELQGTKVQ